MLDAFIIDEIRRRERERDGVQPHAERPGERPRTTQPSANEEPSGRGFVIIDRDRDDFDDNGLTVIDM